MGKSTGKIIQTIATPGYKTRYMVTDMATKKAILVTTCYKTAVAELYRGSEKIILFPKARKTK